MNLDLVLTLMTDIMTHSSNFARDDLPPFDPKVFYNFHNDVAPEKSLSSGIKTDSLGVLNMTMKRNFSSSENWQLFFQKQCLCYFIRNYDYGEKFQLGLARGSRSVPQIYPATGALEQQWKLEPFDEEGRGPWKFKNMLLGNGSFLTLNDGNNVPAMQSNEDGGNWDLPINPSAGNVGSAWLIDVQDIEVRLVTTGFGAVMK